MGVYKVQTSGTLHQSRSVENIKYNLLIPSVAFGNGSICYKDLDMTEMDRGKYIRNLAIGEIAKFTENYFYSTDWTSVATLSGVLEILDRPKHERVRRAQGWGDPDYAGAITTFLIDLFDIDYQVGIAVIEKVIKRDELSPEAVGEIDRILIKLSDSYKPLRPQTPIPIAEELIQVIGINDDYFYKKLITEINALYASGHTISLSILVRKLFENLIIDILRKKYSASQLNFYFDASQGRFHGFSILLKNLDHNKDDFKDITSELNTELIKKISKYRGVGNSSAHSIDVDLTLESIKTAKNEINYLVQFLLRIFRLI